MTELVRVDQVDERARVEALALAFVAGRKSPHTRRAYTADIGSWLDYCAAAGVDPLDARHTAVLLWLRLLDERGESEATRARRLAAVGSWYRWLIREEQTRRNPCDLEPAERPRVDRDHSTTAVLSGEQVDALLAAADRDGSRAAALVWLLYAGGLRVGELLGADVEDIGPDRGSWVLTIHGKGRKERTVPLPPALFGRLDAYLSTRADAVPERLPAIAPGARPRRPLFVTRTGKRLRPTEVERLLRRLARSAGLPPALVDRLTPHSLRHSYATHALDAGVPLDEVQDALGHADPRTTRRYDRRQLDPDRHPTYRLLAERKVTRASTTG